MADQGTASIEKFCSKLTRMLQSAKCVFALHLSPEYRREQFDEYRRELSELRQCHPAAALEIRQFGQDQSNHLAEVVTDAEQLNGLRFITELDAAAADEAAGIIAALENDGKRIRTLCRGTAQVSRRTNEERQKTNGRVNTESEHREKKPEKNRRMRAWDRACLNAFRTNRRTDSNAKLKPFISDWILQHESQYRDEKPEGLSVLSMYAKLRRNHPELTRKRRPK